MFILAGPAGPSGATGTCVCPERNIKQCVWSQLDDGRDAGQIKVRYGQQGATGCDVHIDPGTKVMYIHVQAP